MRRFPADASIQKTACYPLTFMLRASGAVQRVRDAGGAELVVCALRAHINDAVLVHACCLALDWMIVAGLGSSISIDVEAAASLAAAALLQHPSDAGVQKIASQLTEHLLECRSTPLVDGPSPEGAALARVPALKERRDFVSLERDMDAFPEYEELQCAGCDAIDDIISDGGSRDDAAAAGAIECVVRVLDLFPRSADTQRTSMMALAQFTHFEDGTAHRAGSAGAVRLVFRALRSTLLEGRSIVAALTMLGRLLNEDQFRAEALKLGGLAVGLAALQRCFFPRSLSHVSLSLSACTSYLDTPNMGT